MRKLKPVTPGEPLLQEFLKPMGISLRAQVIHDTEVAERALTSELAKIKPWEGVAVDGRRALTRA